MARILSIEIPDNKRAVISLTYIKGIGNTTAKEILKKSKVDESIRVKDLSETQLKKIREVAATYTTEGDLRRETAYNIKRLMEIGSYRGIRHRKHLPVRGQSTQTNARTRKGSRKTVANKKKAS